MYLSTNTSGIIWTTQGILEDLKSNIICFSLLLELVGPKKYKKFRQGLWPALNKICVFNRII